jgi:hypothetical protein
MHYIYATKKNVQRERETVDEKIEEGRYSIID